MPVNRLPEFVVYEVLQSAGIPYVPMLLDSGIVDAGTFRYRVEYLVIADAGVPLTRYLELNARGDIENMGAIASTALQQVSICLARAWQAGILKTYPR
ncbi:hypothetical protein EV183_004089 [Coemansia sp. RSA 2336]|nr:hypothetical protein EV183_004089 [Coemansia sp. RSA 2336]